MTDGKNESEFTNYLEGQDITPGARANHGLCDLCLNLPLLATASLGATHGQGPAHVYGNLSVAVLWERPSEATSRIYEAKIGDKTRTLSKKKNRDLYHSGFHNVPKHFCHKILKNNELRPKHELLAHE